MRGHSVNFVTFSSEIPDTLRNELLGYGGFTCDMCGLAPGERDSVTGETAHMYISPKMSGSGESNLSNLRVSCSICVEGRKNITTEKPSAIWLLSQVRRAGQEEQRAVLNWLQKKFKK